MIVKEFVNIIRDNLESKFEGVVYIINDIQFSIYINQTEVIYLTTIIPDQCKIEFYFSYLNRFEYNSTDNIQKLDFGYLETFKNMHARNSKIDHFLL